MELIHTQDNAQSGDGNIQTLNENKNAHKWNNMHCLSLHRTSPTYDPSLFQLFMNGHQ